MTDKQLEKLLKKLSKYEVRNCGDIIAYGRMKLQISGIGLTSRQYEIAIKFISDYLGI
jgi:hypothetical protein